MMTTTSTGTTFNTGTVSVTALDGVTGEAANSISGGDEGTFTYVDGSGTLTLASGIWWGSGKTPVMELQSNAQFYIGGTSFDELGIQGESNQDFTVEAAGTGNLNLGTNGVADTIISAANDAILRLSAPSTETVNGLQIDAAETGSAPTISIESTTNTPDTNVDIVIVPNGTGVISVAGTTNYEDNVTDDDDIPNKKYVDDEIANIATNQIVQLDTSVTVTDTGTDGTITTVADGTTVFTQTDTASTVNAGTFSVTNLSTDGGVVFTDASGTLSQDAHFLFQNVGGSGNNQLTLGNAGGEDGTLDLGTDGIITNGGDLSISSGNDVTFENGGVVVFDTDINMNSGNISMDGNSITSAGVNDDISILPTGTGVISVAGTTDYENNVTADDDIPNKLYVDNAIADSVTPGSLGSVTGTVDLTSATAQNIGAADGIPANATVLSVTLDVTAASDAVTTVTIGDATNGAASYMAASENDPETTGIYLSDVRVANGGSAQQAQATVATPGTVGSATVIITYRNS
jgi:hypothetical protein